MNSTVLKEIMAFLFGRKYYANIVATKGTTKQEICSYIFATKEAANRNNSVIPVRRNCFFPFTPDIFRFVRKKLNHNNQ